MGERLEMTDANSPKKYADNGCRSAVSLSQNRCTLLGDMH